MNYEKPQKGNPYNLVVNQHIFSKKSIERFVNNSGIVDVFYKKTSKNLRLKPADKLFCARRVWDQKTELGYMKQIEDSFQALATKIVTKRIMSLGELENRIISNFFILWQLRFNQYLNPIKDTELKGVLPGKQFPKDEEEQLEKNNILFMRNKASIPIIPCRFMNGLIIQFFFNERRMQMKNNNWGIVNSIDGEFIVPDNFANTVILPVSPRIILVGNSENLNIDRSEVIKVNQLAISMSNIYYFAKNLSNCPK